ncbi:MAG: penicillin-binding protein 2 [Chloroflexi bacterium]|nr:penicillin-binding protein 2 [Chloroflexota bacterium]
MANQNGPRPSDLAGTTRRAQVVMIGLVTLILLLVIPLFVWQIVRFDELRIVANDVAAQMQRKAPVARGAILDRNGMPLALNTWAFTVDASPYAMGSEATRRRTAEHLALLLGKPIDFIWKKVADPKVTWVVLDTGVSLAIGNQIKSRNLPGIGLQLTASRQYPAGGLAAHVLGFVAAQGDGIYGLESYYNKQLHGNDSQCLSDIGYTPARLTLGVRDFQPSTTACDLVLTLDWAIQDVVERELTAGIERTKAASGTVIVIEPSTGRILAMASRPAYDPNRFFETAGALLNNPAVSIDYEPGSVIKIMTMAAALDSGQFTPASTMVDTGEIIVGGRSIQNWDKKSHGRVNMTDCLAMSLNVCSAYLSTSMGPNVFYKYAELFGFGKPSRIDVANEAQGTIRAPGTPGWYVSDLGTNSFGQGMTATPLQVAMMAAVIANDGVLMKPYLADTVLGQGQARTVAPVRVRSVVSSDTAHTLAGMLANALEKENIPVQVPGMRVAGKTGTASVVNPVTQRYDENATIASFVGWAPVEAPRFVMLVKLDRPQTSQYGSDTAGPVFREIARKLVTMLDIGSKAVNR